MTVSPKNTCPRAPPRGALPCRRQGIASSRYRLRVCAWASGLARCVWCVWCARKGSVFATKAVGTPGPLRGGVFPPPPPPHRPTPPPPLQVYPTFMSGMSTQVRHLAAFHRSTAVAIAAFHHLSPPFTVALLWALKRRPTPCPLYLHGISLVHERDQKLLRHCLCTAFALPLHCLCTAFHRFSLPLNRGSAVDAGPDVLQPAGRHAGASHPTGSQLQ